MISLLKNLEEFKRHKKYVKADINVKKEMKFSSPGPLIIEHQKDLVSILNNLQKEYLPNKPTKTYEYDVLYPEV